MGKQRTHLLVGLSLALVLVALPAAASAQSCTTTPTYLGSNSYNTNCGNTNCTTAPTYVGSKSYETTCYTSGSDLLSTIASNPNFGLGGPLPPNLGRDLLALQNSAPPTAPAPPPAPADQGITISLTTGGQKYLARGTFVKIGDAPAIYWVYGAQLHAFSTWSQFLNAGGMSDLSNVVIFSSMSGAGLIGAPV